MVIKQDLKNVHQWFERLDDEDKAFLKRVTLASGSLKAIAAEYGISYPTVRLRLDRLIEKIRIYDDREIRSEFERTLRALHSGQRVTISGYLIEARAPDGWRWRSSLTREDPGAGACELVWLEKIAAN